MDERDFIALNKELNKEDEAKLHVSRWPFSQTTIKMKRVKLFVKVSDFEAFVNRTDIEILQVDVKAVELSFCFPDGFSAVVFYREFS